MFEYLLGLVFKSYGRYERYSMSIPLAVKYCGTGRLFQTQRVASTALI